MDAKKVAGTRFMLGWYAANPRGGCDVGTETREKCASGSRVIDRATVRTLPDMVCGRTWSAEWNRIEADRILADAVQS